MPDTQRTPSESLKELIEQGNAVKDQIEQATIQAAEAVQADMVHGQPFLITGLTVFILACFVGYHVVWRVTPALHSPLMGITNAISSVIIVGAIMAVWPKEEGFSLLGFLAVIFASVNIFGGFIITRRMLSMFKKKGS
ncbi:MAG TPA: NAD(P) transhydrogenase subunit alpha [Alphaproteobacteria bacterium]|nr:NAD(P) transhydrogenase subunit alpha [Alphaproteobacteria bacterium]USO04787.1 MAG: NAD(P) transhydrogenase subunit alpha [Rhodospirillales bacterium]HOO81974.1 NAD(P) transhydrogenase subunit alpha [Alphaproteobacteria bacterium]